MKNILKYKKFNENVSTIYQSNITTEMLEKWKDKYREIFKDEPNSMNTINLLLKSLDKETNQSKIKKINKRLLEYYENDLARSGRILCNHCSNKMEVYYTVKCFHCDACKPKIIEHKGNLYESGKWLENQEEDFIFDDFWNILIDDEIIRSNDSYCMLEDSNEDDEYGKFIKIWKKHFPIKGILWFVSW